MKTNREIIESAIKNNEKVSFLTSSYFEKDVEIVGYNTDDMENRDFQYKVKSGDVYTRFENNVIFKCAN
jgi:hypothetical protein